MIFSFIIIIVVINNCLHAHLLTDQANDVY